MSPAALVLALLTATPVEVAPRVYEKIEDAQTPRGLRIGFGFGRYTPNVDAEFSGATPYADIMGGGSWMLRPKVGWVLPLSFGELSVNGSVGWFDVSGRAFVEGSDARSGGETSLRLIPVTGTVGLRTTLLEDRMRLPLHPYLELGGSYTFWRISKGDGSTASVGSAEGSGGAAGLVAVLGLALALERFDEQGRRSLRRNFGVHGTDLFIEWRYDRTLDVLGGSPLRVGDSTWQAGLQLLF